MGFFKDLSNKLKNTVRSEFSERIQTNSTRFVSNIVEKAVSKVFENRTFEKLEKLVEVVTPEKIKQTKRNRKEEKELQKERDREFKKQFKLSEVTPVPHKSKKDTIVVSVPIPKTKSADKVQDLMRNYADKFLDKYEEKFVCQVVLLDTEGRHLSASHCLPTFDAFKEASSYGIHAIMAEGNQSYGYDEALIRVESIEFIFTSWNFEE